MDPSPFNFDDADVTLRTSDGVSLKAHTLILKYASPFFKDLFSLPQPASKDPGPASVDISESGKVMHTLLMFAYPMEDPHISSLSLLSDVLGAAKKYDMVDSTQNLRRLLVSPHFLHNETLLVYAVASQHQLEEEMKVASKASLHINLAASAPLTAELREMTGYDYQRLVNFHHTRGIAAQKVLERRGRGGKSNLQRCPECRGRLPEWWKVFLERTEVELLKVPTTDVIFSFKFLGDIARSGTDCDSCGTGILMSHSLLEHLKEYIDGLNDTI